MPASANTSHGLDSERPMKVASRKHSIYTRFPKDKFAQGVLAEGELANQYFGQKILVT